MRFHPFLLLPTLFLIQCAPAPDSLSKRAGQVVPLPARYDGTSYPEPQIASSLLKLFNNPELNSLTRRALQQNPEVALSASRLAEAGFNLEKSRSALFPTLTGSTGLGKSRTSAGSFDTFDYGLDASWELDVWGRLKNSTRASAFDQAAAAADLASVRQSIAAQTMQAWFDLVSTTKLLELAHRETESLESTRQLVERRFEAGTASFADLELTRADLENARADLERTLDSRDQAARRLKVFLGEYPDARLTSTGDWPSLSRGVPAGLPSDLLRNRPDIDAAYQRIRAADSRVKVAHADLFPSFSLTASTGQTSTSLSRLLLGKDGVYSLFANMSSPLYDAGQRQAELGAAGERAQQALESYRSTVLTAFREVEDALSSEHYLAREERARQTALAAARSAEKRTRRDYEAGLSDLLTLLESQRRVFSTEEQTITLHATRLNNRVALALALGKGI
ncbi:efflux transporter outer membrane subunit [Roseibacillus persicicus]|uniref:efflux transporter outer membrane subunit n=1 Tax=Roseibacillus persicicus TaxID=454148 RepID=UPI00280FC987|nr:efflux transporter outer membrane subunit [Roseibacillus persicicus]MDQ8188881.1 efflux transporter outer membrane subunit [Roseibacillus persicicus]